MPVIADLRDDIAQYLHTHGLWKKWLKAKQLFETDPSHNPDKPEPKLTAKTKKKQRRLNLELRNSQR